MTAGCFAQLTAYMASFQRFIRYAYRLPLIAWHAVIDLPIAVFLMLPIFHGVKVGHTSLEAWAVGWWSRGMMRIFGLRVKSIGVQSPVATLFVANHVSWLDIIALHGTRLMGFVAKQEINGWPVVGWMARRGQTIFHKRGSQDSLGGVLETMVRRLRTGRSVGAFPEGGTRNGTELGPFHARIFFAAVEAPAPVQPVAIQYGKDGASQSRIAFQKGESFGSNLWRLIGEPACDVEVHYLEPIQPEAFNGRSGIADTARARIAAALGLS